MHKITSKQIIANNIKRLEVEARQIAQKAKAGQFVMVRADATAENIPLSIVDCDSQKGIITLVVEETGFSTQKLGALHIGESLFSILGPLGMPAEIKEEGIVACVGDGIGIAQIFPICRAHHKRKNKVIGLIGAKTKKDLILESQMRLNCHKLYITTADGSYEKRGSVVDILPEIARKEKVSLVYAAGRLALLEDISRKTRPLNIKTYMSLNPPMMDGVGLCGSCRVKVGGQILLACIDGPQFDAHMVDFNDLMLRIKS